MQRTSILLVIVLSVLVACSSGGGPTATPDPTATPEPVLVTQVEDIVGVWQSVNKYRDFHHYIEFTADGSARRALRVPENLADQPIAVGTFHFEGDQLVIEDVEHVNNLMDCLNNTGVYEAHLTDGLLKLTVVEEACDERLVRISAIDFEPVP
jgi:hypothetical protein